MKMKLKPGGEFGRGSCCRLGRADSREGVFSTPGQVLVSLLLYSDLRLHIGQLTRRKG